MNTWEIIVLVLEIAGSLGLFLFGMGMMSESLQKAAGDKMREVLKAFTSNRFKAVLTGAFVTGVIQSSSATTVMVVSFVNAGLLQLRNAIGVIMGANIGTTLTAWIITLLGLGKFNMSDLSIPLIGFGFVMMYSRNIKVKQYGEFLIGFAILFLGLAFLKTSMPDIKSSQAVIEFIKDFSGAGFGNIMVFVFIGTALTVIMQSSSAMMALTLVLCNQGIIPFEAAAALVLGENIGTTITANLAATIGNVASKRAARAHLLFNMMGVIWMLLIFKFYLKGIAMLTVDIEGEDPYMVATAVPFALSLFHTTFNIINTCLLVWFLPFIERTTVYMVKKAKSPADDISKLKYIDSGMVNISEMSIGVAAQEIEVYAKRVETMYEILHEFIKKETLDEEQFNRIKKYEDITDMMEIEIGRFLSKVSSHEISDLGSKRIFSMLRIIDNLENIGDNCMQIAIVYKNRIESGIKFSPTMNDNIDKLFDIVKLSINEMIGNLHKDYRTVTINEAVSIEDRINEFRDSLKRKQIKEVQDRIYSYEEGSAYSATFSLLEKLGDNVLNITEAIANLKRSKGAVED